MAVPGRITVVAPLPPLRGFRRALALDRAGAPRAVVLAFPPVDLGDDAARLEPLLRSVEAAGRVRHPAAAPVLGTETVDGALAVLEEHRPGTSLRAVLDAAGRMPADFAARVGFELASALARIHAVEAEGAPLAHGALDAARIGVGDDGQVFLCGLGLAPGATPADDLRALGAVLHECLAGEPPGDPPRRLDVPGVPAALAAAVDRASGAAPSGYATAGALAEAVASAVAAPATAAEVAAYVDAVLPPDEGDRAEFRRALAAEVTGGAGVPAAPAVEPTPIPDPVVVEPTPVGTPRPPAVPPGVAARAAVLPDPAAMARAADAARTFPRPALARGAPRLAIAVGVIALAAGFAAGFAAQRVLRAPEARAAPEATAPAVEKP